MAMTMILDGRVVRAQIAATLKAKIAPLEIKPKLVIFQVGVREDSSGYIRQKQNFGRSIGAVVEHVAFPEDIPEEEFIARIRTCNADPAVHGIIVQLPIPEQFDKAGVIDAVSPEKDVDGLTSAQVLARKEGRDDAVIPATARGIIELLSFYRVPIQGKKVAVLGRSALVGTPTAEAFRKAGAQVEVCHSQTLNTRDVTKTCDIIVVAIGKPKLINESYINAGGGQVVVDVGINSVEGGPFDSALVKKLEEEIEPEPLDKAQDKKIVGDVDFEKVAELVSAISPVPGGVGPMTVASLFENLVSAYKRQIS